MINLPSSPTFGQAVSTTAGSYTWDGSAWVFTENMIWRPFSALTDTFTSPTFDTTKWEVMYGATVESGRAKLRVDWNYSSLESYDHYTLKDSSWFAKVTVPAAVRSSIEIEVRAGYGYYPSIEYLYLNGAMQLHARYWQDLVEHGSPLYPYNATTMAWWKISESNGVVSFSYGPDGVNWTTFHTVHLDVGIEPIRMYFEVGDYNQETAIDYAYIDNINVAP